MLTNLFLLSMFIFNSLTNEFYECFLGTSRYIRRALSRRYSDVKSEYPQHVLYPRNRERGLDFANSRQASDLASFAEFGPSHCEQSHTLGVGSGRT
jgi:hypothetical protein